MRHRLAESLVAIETAGAALDAAWEDGSGDNAAIAKALAGRGARITARHCQQVLARASASPPNILCTVYVRRALVLDQLLGSSTLLTRELGARVTSTGGLPPLLRL